MRKLLLIVMAMLAGVGSLWAFDIVVRHADGTSASYNSSQVSNVSFAPSGVVTINLADGSSATVSAADFDYLTFDPNGSVGVNSIVCAASPFTIDGAAVVGSAATTPIAVYNIGGELVARGAGRVSLRELPAGVYVVTSGDQTVKICLQ